MAFTGQSFTFNQSAPVLQATTPFVINSLTVTQSYAIPSGSSCVSGGPITISNGYSVTIPSGSKWVIL
jgi:hypothetical protein